jgi:FAD:protein FMN transferase
VKQTALIMGMPITVEVVDDRVGESAIHDTFEYFRSVDEQYSTYKPTSEISKINQGLPRKQWSKEMREIMKFCEQTKKETDGFFDIEHNGKLDPSGLVKGWAIDQAAKRLRKHHIADFYIEAGGDIQTWGLNGDGEPWRIGIRNPFNMDEIVKVIQVSMSGVATSGTYVRGQHIYDPHAPGKPVHTVKSLTVIGRNIYDADRFATAAFAMGEDGINFIETLPGLEGYMIDRHKKATMTSGFTSYVA